MGTSNIKSHITIFLFLLGLIITFQNCTGTHDLDSAYLLSVQSQAEKVIENNCTSCHSPNSGIVTPIPDISDVATLEAQTINGYPVFVAGEPQNSLLYQVLIDEISPHDQLNLTDLDLKVISSWIKGDEFLIPDTNVYYYQVDAVLKSSCYECHGANGNSGGYSVDNFDTVLRRVTPGNPLTSELYQRVVHVDENQRMPQGKAPLSPDDVQLIYNWILSGAQNK